MIVPIASGTEIILTLRLSAYAPTLQDLPEVKDQFYAHHDSVVKHIPLYEYIYLLGDSNWH